MNNSVEEFFENSLQEWKSIEEIQNLLNESFKAQISPEFCSNLVHPILLHKVTHNSAQNTPTVYAEMLHALFNYHIEQEMVEDNSIFRDTALLLVDTFELYINKEANQSALNVDLRKQDIIHSLLITSHACCSMIAVDDGVEYDSICNLLWQRVPEILMHLSTDLNVSTMKIASNVAKLGTRLVIAEIVLPYDSEVLNFLTSLVSLAIRTELDKDTLQVVAESISQICRHSPKLTLLYTSDLAQHANKLASNLAHSDNLALIQALYNISYLLVRNNTPIPWLDDFLPIQTDSIEIELLKENISAIQNTSNQDTDLDMKPIFAQHYTTAVALIQALVSLEVGNEQSSHLLSQLKTISICTDNTPMEEICRPQIKELTEYVTQLLFKDPDLAEAIVDMLGYTIPNFLVKYIRFALPYAIIYNHDEDTVMGIANAFGKSTVSLCRDEAYHIILALLLEQDEQIKNSAVKRLQRILQENDCLKKLTTSNHTRLMATLAMNLGHPASSEKYYKAVSNLKNIVRGNSSTLSDYISSLIMAISEKISVYITEKRLQTPTHQYPYALESLTKIMSLLERNIDSHNLHLMKIFNTISELPNMQSESLDLWKTYIELLDAGAIATYINPIVKGLLNILVSSPADVRLDVAKVFEGLLHTNSGLTEEHFASLPVLPDFTELATVKRYVGERQTVKLKSDIRKIILDFYSFDDVQVLTSLEKLYRILIDYPDCRFLVDKLYAHLFNLLRKYNTHVMISYYSAVCLGKLGAIDPSSMKMDVLDDTVFVMRNFNNEDENLNYICDLIIHHIFPSYNAINDEPTRHSIEYSIQTLVRIAGYKTVPEMKESIDNVRAYHHWRKHPRHVQEFLAPFLESAYQVAYPEIHIEYPIFVNSLSFKEWVKNWYCRMVKGAIGSAGQIFSACLPMVQYDMVDVALHLLPYLVLHIIFSGSSDDSMFIVRELQSVLDQNASPTQDLEKIKMNRFALQVAVAITEYCRKWLNHICPGDLSMTSVADRVNNFLRQITDRDMGVAAFNAKAYPQALMHFETHLKEKSNNVLKDQEIMNYLRQIYIEIDDLIDYKALMETFTVITNRDEQIAQHVELGEWDFAETLYKSKIQDNPADLSAYTGYLECLSKSNRFGSLLYSVDHELADASLWQPQINSFRIEAAWRVQDWATLEKGVHMSMERNTQALLGCALHQMKNNLSIALTNTIGEARSNLTQQIAMNSTRSYRKSYPQVFDLQLLVELENAQEVWNSDDPAETIKLYESRWDESLKQIMPRSQFRLNLLELRKAAFFNIRDSAKVKLSEAQIWLDLAKENRKMGNMVASLNALKNAEHLFGQEMHYEMAKWYFKKGSIEKAVKLLKYHSRDGKFDTRDALLLSDIYMQHPNSVDMPTLRSVFSSALNGDHKKLEKASHNCASYYMNRIPRNSPLNSSKLSVQEYVIKMSIRAVEFGSKYYYSSMSRIFNTYFEMEKQLKEAQLTPGSETAKKVSICMKKVDAHMKRLSEEIQPFQFVLFLTRLISHLSTDNKQIASRLTTIIKNCFVAYPKNTIWLVLGALDSDSPNVAQRMAEIFNKARGQSADGQIIQIITQATAVKKAFYNLLTAPIDKTVEHIDLNDSGYMNPFEKLRDLDLYMPNEASILPTLPAYIRKNDTTLRPFRSELPTIKFFESKITVMKSLQKPKRIKAMGSDGKTYSFLLKNEDDLRNDARTMEFFYMINYFLRKNPKSRDRDLYIRTFAILPMGSRWGLIEWVDNLNALKGIVSDYWEADGNYSVTTIGQKMNNQKLSLSQEKTKYFVEKILPACPPVFYRWFLRKFPEPNQWLNSRTRYIKTLAVMSIVGHMVGLGDRHAENIMFDETNGDVVHVDLNLLFGKGKSLPVPELVPFRLTRNLVHAMGVLGTRGLFQSTCETTLEVLLFNKDSLLSVFQTLLNELEATEVSSPPKTSSISLRTSTVSLQTAPKSTHKIMASLQPKFSTKQEDVGNEVRSLIAQATSTSNLAQMFPGWAPFV